MKTPAILILFVSLAPSARSAPLWRDMIPAPKEAKETGEPIALPAGAMIAAPDTGKAAIGASEINQRLRELGQQSPQILDPAVVEKNPAPFRICIGSPAANEWTARLIKAHKIRLNTDFPGKQGYVIRFLHGPKSPVVLLAGSDPQGTLYACVTFRYLLENRSGKAFVSQVNITDWPDFKYRGYSSMLFYGQCYAAKGRTVEAQVAFFKQRMDWLLRHKINATADYAYLPNNLKVPTKPNPVFAPANQYARERGILPSVYFSTCVGEGGQKDDPLYRNAAVIGHKRLFTWSDEAVLKKRAEVVARYVHANHFGILALHPPDGGGPVNPSMWNNRSDADRKRWRDDQRAEADAFVFNTFYQAARQLEPEVKVAYTVYPYSAVYLDYDFLKPAYPTLTREQCERNGRLYWTEFERLIPKDAHLVVWNTWPKYMDTFRSIFKGRPVYYWCDFAGRWHRQPYFTAVHRYLGENFYDNDEDIVMPSHDRIRPNLVNQLCSVEFSWNRHAPGAAPFNGRYWNMFKDAYEPAIIIRDFTARACRNIWGQDAGPLMAPLFQNNVNPALLLHTEHVIKYENKWRRKKGKPDIRLDTGLVAEQVAGIAKALPGLQEIMDEHPQMSDFAFRCAVYFYRRLRVLELVAKLRLRILQAGESLEQDKPEEVVRLIEEGNALLQEELPKLARMAKATEKLPHLMDRFSRGKAGEEYGVLLRNDVDFNQYRRGFLQLSKQLRDRKIEIGALKHEGIIKVAIYNAAADGGKSIGHQGALATAKSIPGVSAEFITDLSISNLVHYDVLIYPQCYQGQSSTPYDFHTGLRRYVAEAGGAVWFQHDSIGSTRSEFGARTAFPEISRGTLGRVDSNQMLIAVRHPITARFRTGQELAHTYYDHWTIRRGRKGIIICKDPDGRPVWVAGKVGKGRVLYDGTIFLNKQDQVAAAAGNEQILVSNALHWLAQRKAERPAP